MIHYELIDARTGRRIWRGKAPKIPALHDWRIIVYGRHYIPYYCEWNTDEYVDGAEMFVSVFVREEEGEA